MLAALATFFAAVSVVLAAVGLYGVLDYSIFQRRREFGIRLAVGAQSTDIAGRVIAQVFGTVFPGVLMGLGLGLFAAQYVKALLYRVNATDAAVLALPLARIIHKNDAG